MKIKKLKKLFSAEENKHVHFSLYFHMGVKKSLKFKMWIKNEIFIWSEGQNRWKGLRDINYCYKINKGYNVQPREYGKYFIIICMVCNL